jgi:hypothetical protein
LLSEESGQLLEDLYPLDRICLICELGSHDQDGLMDRTMCRYVYEIKTLVYASLCNNR